MLCYVNTVSPVFWKYINSERQIHDNIGDLKTFDKDGNMRTACTDSDKAEVLGNFFAGVFKRESEFVEATAQPIPCQFLANVNSRSRSLYAIARPSVVCRLSVVCL